MRNRVRHAAALAFALVLLSSCAAQRGPTPQDVRRAENQYEECMRTTDYPSECAYEKDARDFWLKYIEFHVADNGIMPPPYLTPPNLSWGF